MLGVLLLLFQGGSIEPPSLHSSEPEGLWLAAQEQERVRLYHQLAPSLVQLRLRSELSEEGAAGAWTEQQLVLSGVVLRETEEGVLVVVPGIWKDQRASELAVYDLGGKSYSAEAVASDAAIGLSLLRVNGLFLEVPAIGRAETLPTGSSVVVLGNGFGLYGSYSMGMISGRGRSLGDLEGLLQITNPINPGDGGGIVADRHGRLIGIALTSLDEVMRRQSDAAPMIGDQRVRPTGVAFALPIGRVMRTFAEPLDFRPPGKRPVLGVQVREAVIDRRIRRKLELDAKTALAVVRVEQGYPAEAAGIRVGDIVIALGGMPVQSFACLFEWLDRAPNQWRVTLVRDGELLEIAVELGPSIQASPPPSKRGGD